MSLIFFECIIETVEMPRKFLINRLDKDELTYELTIRGIASGNCEEMRHRLVLALQMEKSGESLRYPEYPYSFDEDFQVVKRKFAELNTLLEKLNSGRDSREAMKLQTKLAHVAGRVENMECSTDDQGEAQRKLKSELYAEIITLKGRMETKLDEISKKAAPPPLALSVLEQQTDPAASFQQGIANASRSSALAGDDPDNFIGSVQAASIPPHKWSLTKFTGDRKGISINAFFERIEELRQARGVTKSTLLDSGIDLFADKAFKFYKDCRTRVSTWDEMVKEFRDEYLPASHRDDLFEEIRRRTQHPTESIGVYLAVMSTYFARLGCHISEEAKLAIIMKNLHPFYQERLREPLPASVELLRKACRSMEARRDMINSYVEPSSSRRGNTIEKDLAYVDTGIEEDGRVAAISSQVPSYSEESKRKEIICYRCKKPGHKAVGCALPSSKRCYKCGKEGFTVRTCPNCKTGNGSQHP